RCCPDLVAEALHHVGRRHELLADRLQGHDAVELLVLCLVDLSHTALAEPFQQDIRAEHQILAVALKQLIDLIRRKPAALQQIAGQRLRITESPFQLTIHFLKLGSVEQCQFGEAVDQGGDRSDGHASHSARRERPETHGDPRTVRTRVLTHLGSPFLSYFVCFAVSINSPTVSVAAWCRPCRWRGPRVARYS